jgi:hypothetical protein
MRNLNECVQLVAGASVIDEERVRRQAVGNVYHHLAQTIPGEVGGD